jgi:hypothetical protein
VTLLLVRSSIMMRLGAHEPKTVADGDADYLVQANACNEGRGAAIATPRTFRMNHRGQNSRGITRFGSTEVFQPSSVRPTRI